MKKAALVTSAFLLGFLTVGVAFAAGTPEIDSAAATFGNPSTPFATSAPTACSGEGGHPYISSVGTTRVSATDLTPSGVESDMGDFGLTATKGSSALSGAYIKTTQVVNFPTGRGWATG